MKLVNRKTGEVVDLVEGCLKDESDKIVIRPVAVLEKEYQYDSLAQLNEDWKDCEETKEYYSIYYDGSISKFSGEAGDDIEDMKSIGNFFKTEEAEEAVEKLKAYKRLKDKGFKFVGRSFRDWIIKYIFEGYNDTDILQMIGDLNFLLDQQPTRKNVKEMKDQGYIVYLPAGRIKFESGLGKKSSSPAFGSVVIKLISSSSHPNFIIHML